MPNISNLLNVLEELAPNKLAADWDRTGLHVGKLTSSCKNVLLTIDLTESVVLEAINSNIDCIISYHPLIFSPIIQLNESTKTSKIALMCAENHISVISPHTTLDASPNGMGAALVKLCGEGTTIPICPAFNKEKMSKIIVFAPKEASENIRNSISKLGGGQIGKYKNCSFITEGKGTFFSSTITTPFIGEKNAANCVDEQRIEMVIPNTQITSVVSEILKKHPYETPAIDLVPLEPLPILESGRAWMQILKNPETIENVLNRVAKKIKINSLRFSKSHLGDLDKLITKIAGCPGSGKQFAKDASSAGAELFITGEMTHHDLLDLSDLPMDIALLGHYYSESHFLPELLSDLKLKMKKTNFKISDIDESPWKLFNATS